MLINNLKRTFQAPNCMFTSSFFLQNDSKTVHSQNIVISNNHPLFQKKDSDILFNFLLWQNYSTVKSIITFSNLSRFA